MISIRHPCLISSSTSQSGAAAIPRPASNDVTSIARATYFWARLIYAPLYYFDVPVLKTTSWFVGLMATLTLAFELLA